MLLKAFREKPGVKIMVALDFSTVSWILEDNDEKFQNSEENFFCNLEFYSYENYYSRTTTKDPGNWRSKRAAEVISTKGHGQVPRGQLCSRTSQKPDHIGIRRMARKERK